MNFPLCITRAAFVGAFVFLLIPLCSQAATIVVSPGEDLAAAVAMASFGDSVLVDSGEYVADNIMMPSGIILAALSQDPEQYPILYTSAGTTLLRCENLSSDTQIERLIFARINPPLEKLPHRGGGVYSVNSAVSFTDCTFRDLLAVYGGAVYCAAGSAPSFFDCHFEDNGAEASGGAISLVGGQTLLLDHCLFTGNSAAAGGSVLNAALGASARMTHCTMSGNGQAPQADITVWDSQLVEIGNSIVTESQGRACYGDSPSTPWFHCSDVYGNPHGDWVGALADQAGLDGNISLSPLFCGADGSISPFELNEDSPCTEEANPSCGSMGAFGVGCSGTTGMDGPVDSEITQNTVPLVTQLRGNYPNPFNPQTTIAFDLSHTDHTSVDVYDLAGRLVRNLHSGVLTAGSHEVMWNGRAADGRMSAAGVYFFRLKTETVMDTRRMTLVK